jgi:hypothetical protein
MAERFSIWRGRPQRPGGRGDSLLLSCCNFNRRLPLQTSRFPPVDFVNTRVPADSVSTCPNQSKLHLAVTKADQRHCEHKSSCWGAIFRPSD